MDIQLIRENKGVYNKEALEALVADCSDNKLPWVETLDTCEVSLELESVHDDLKREVAFYNNTLAAVRIAKARLAKEGVAYKRPDDYFAEMLKSDTHMAKVKDKLIYEQKKITAVEERKKSQAHRRVAKEIQAEKVKERNQQKKDTLEAVKQWKKRKGNDKRSGLNDDDNDQLDSIMSGKRKHGGNDRDDPKKKPRVNHKRESKDAKFGFGGKHRHAKSNTKDSTNDMSRFPGTRAKARGKVQAAPKGGKRAGKAQRTTQRNKSRRNILSRSLRVFATGGLVVLDYQRNLKGTGRDDPEYRTKLQSLNQRTAQRLFHLCFQNGGIYTKFGQQLATFNHGLPKEYTRTLAQLQDQAKAVPFEKAIETVEAELKRPWQENFKEFDRKPIASASLAQVHRAVDHQGRELAVKIQYPHLHAQLNADIQVIKWAFQTTEYFFPDVQIQWLYPEFKGALMSELDFENEKNNSRRIATCLKRNTDVHVPIVYDELSTKKMMSMEFIHGPKISQIDSIKELGLQPLEVSRVLCEVFSEMIFCHGFVHCDPHAGNIFVRHNPDPQAKRKEQIVLLDHGLYREVDDDFRKTYCDLWRAMLMRDRILLEDCGRRLNIGDLAKYLPLLFTYRMISHKGHLDAAMSESERKEMKEDLSGIRFSNVSDFLEQLPRDMLFVFRTNNMIRALNKDLGGTTRGEPPAKIKRVG
ncbi:hypothetical protein BBJ29_002501 [Phytophthora kernoviae]|uniref:ABC1 atypical kinase-like domain-containing protein n=1 Tax=Phytophthora kernoviae TaxID=325452 RepID=A0A3R7K3J6_9STRA|nr:hypothetical protein BBJ29_002501 [Phytophthora kernoviae]